MGSFQCLSVVLVVSVVVLLNSSAAQCGCYKRIFSFGDSIIDNGNFVQAIGNGQSALKEPPFGMTFFHYPTGRVCDGRILIDFYGEYCIDRYICARVRLNTHPVLITVFTAAALFL